MCPFAAELQQPPTMRHGFHALGNDFPTECPGQADHAFENGQIIRIIEHVADEGLVNLELIDGKTL